MNFRSFALISLLTTSFIGSFPVGCQVAFVDRAKVFSCIDDCCDSCPGNEPFHYRYKDTISSAFRSLEVEMIAKEYEFLQALNLRSIAFPFEKWEKLNQKCNFLNNKFFALAMKIAKEKGAYVLITQVHAFCLDDNCDITPEVVAALNKEFKETHS